MDPVSGPSINFLTYVPRSGSTLVSRVLSQSSAVVVVPELALFRDLLASHDDTLTYRSSDELVALLKSDRQFVGLGFTDAEVADVVAGALGRGRAGLIESIVVAYGSRPGGTGRTYLLKIGDAVNYRTEIHALWPESRFVNIQRDPRAVANSLLNTNRAYAPGESMGRGDPYHCARLWAKHFDVVGNMDSAELFTVRYEDFIADPAHGSAAIASFLAANDGQEVQGSTFQVAVAERDIHPLYDAPADPSRVAAWTTEMDHSAQLVIETMLASRMREARYEPVVSRESTTSEKARAVVTAYATHLAATPKWVSARLWEARGDPRVLAARVKNVIRRRVRR